MDNQLADSMDTDLVEWMVALTESEEVDRTVDTTAAHWVSLTVDLKAASMDKSTAAMLAIERGKN